GFASYTVIDGIHRCSPSIQGTNFSNVRSRCNRFVMNPAGEPLDFASNRTFLAMEPPVRRFFTLLLRLSSTLFSQFFTVALLPAMTLWASAAAHSKPVFFGTPAPLLLLISIDGYRADYLDRGYSPALVDLAADGVRAAGLRPAFPTITYPNHYTL